MYFTRVDPNHQGKDISLNTLIIFFFLKSHNFFPFSRLKSYFLENQNTDSAGRLKIYRWQNDALITIAFYFIPFLVIPNIWFEFFLLLLCSELLFHEVIIHCPKILIPVLLINSELNSNVDLELFFPMWIRIHLFTLNFLCWFLVYSHDTSASPQR